MVNRKKGEYAVELGGEWHVLKASFSNIALFEENVMEIYEFADKISQGSMKMTDMVNVVYCFQQNQENKLSQDDIAEIIIANDPVKSIEAIAGFMGVLFGVEEAAEETAEPVTDKKK